MSVEAASRNRSGRTASDEARAGKVPGENFTPLADGWKAHDVALFLDCDGTLAPFSDDPAATCIDPHVVEVLGRLHAHCGAVALVSGRSITELDRLFRPLVLPAAGVHGVERRTAEGALVRPDIHNGHNGAIDEITDLLTDLAAAHAGLICERKPGAVALHYRKRPELGPLLTDFSTRLAGLAPVTLMQGKMVVEFGSSPRTKGDAIRDFMREAPFAGRTPVFAGDDVTDESGFAATQQAGGIGIKVGQGDTCALQRVPDRDAIIRLLELLDRQWSN